MGNKWELISSNISIIKKCPCGKGDFICVTNEYQDDYLNDHNTTESYCDCNICNSQFEFYKNSWIKKNDYLCIKNMENDISILKKTIYKELYTKYLEEILSNFKSKKALYDFLYENRLFRVPGTVQTF